MNRPIPRKVTPASAFMLMECLVYISLVFLVLGAAYVAMYRCIDNSLVLRRSSDDVMLALGTGERWRAEIRSARGPIRLENTSSNQTLYLSGPQAPVIYRFETNALCRRLGQAPWTMVLDHVAASRMELQPRQTLAVWRWELELQPRAKGQVKASRIRPLFTFMAVPSTALAQ